MQWPNSRTSCLLLGKNTTTLDELICVQNDYQHSDGDELTQSEPSKSETFFNQQPANLQAKVLSYILYTYNKY
jgi:hypothetical protein